MVHEAPLSQVLSELVLAVERQSDGLLGSLLLFDAERRTLHHGAAPNLPREYVEAVDGARVGPDVGSCGSAAHHGREVIVVDIERDDRWRAFRDLARVHGLGACWSVPVLDAGGAVLGTFAFYCRSPRAPSNAELLLVRQASRLAALAIERHRAHAELRRLATRDQLTDLPNRALLLDRLIHTLARSLRTGSEVAVVCLDVDDFTLFNDSMGHEMGDWVLRQVAQRLSTTVRPGDTVARFGGDEFVIVADGVDAGGARRLADRLHAALVAPLVHPDGSEHVVSATLGVALARAGSVAADAIRRADSALYDAKRTGVPTRLYSSELRRRATAQLQLHGALRRALAREEMHLAYQPVLDLVDGGIVAFEALMRWDNPQLGRVPPSRFIPAAEETGLIIELGDWALAAAAAQGRRWADLGAPVAVAVNISSRQLADAALPARVERIVADAGLDPEYLVIEITETALIEHDEQAARSLSALSDLGAAIALDDFGTGYSSFARLRRLPIGIIKIDREFVAGLGADPDADAIVTAMVGLAQGLGLLVTAEGVETPEQLSALSELGCTHVQGHLLGRPQSAAEATRTLLNQSALPPG
nr:EAL domain-containing protein [Conexibacter arvalis]